MSSYLITSGAANPERDPVSRPLAVDDSSVSYGKAFQAMALPFPAAFTESRFRWQTGAEQGIIVKTARHPQAMRSLEHSVC